MCATRKYSEPDNKKWLSVLDVSMMSSEESGEDELYVKPLVWRAPNVTNFFIGLDSTFMKNKSAQARRQTSKEFCRKCHQTDRLHLSFRLSNFAPVILHTFFFVI